MNFPALYIEADMIQHLDAGEGFTDILHLQYVFHSHSLLLQTGCVGSTITINICSIRIFQIKKFVQTNYLLFGPAINARIYS
jgi:hypothetical protein